MGKLFVTGANGLLGSKIVSLAKSDFDVVSLHHTRPLQKNSKQLDITDRVRVLNTFGRTKPDAVIHTAAETNVDKCETEREYAWKVNVEGTRNIAEACSEINAKLVFISTDYVFDGEKGDYKEQDEPNPISYYGLTKLEAEKQLKKFGRDYAILRTSVIYGWHPWKANFVSWAISQLRRRNKINVVEDQCATPTFADNLAEMVTEIATKDLQGVYHASGSERVSRYEFAKQIAEVFGLDFNLVEPIKMSHLANWVAKRPRDSSLNTNKIRKQLRAKPLNVTEGLQKMKEEEDR